MKADTERKVPVNRNYIYILILFILFVGPGPIALFINRYTAAFVPLLSLVAVVYLLRREMAAADWNAVLKNKANYRWTWFVLKYGIIAHAANTVLMSLLLGGQNPEVRMDDLLGEYLIMPFVVIVVAPMIEEIVYRKILFSFFEKKTGFWIGAVVSSALFALGHLDLTRLPVYFAVGLLLCFAYKKSGTIAVPIFAHMALNLLSIIARTISAP